MSQFDWSGGAIVTSTKTGTQLGSDLNNWKNAVDTSNSGTGRPSYAGDGMVWLDTTTAAAWEYKLYDGTGDISLFTIDSTGQTGTISKNIITDATAVTAVSGDYVLISDVSDSNNIKKALVSDLAGGITPPGSSTANGISVWSDTNADTLLSTTATVSSFGALSLSNTTASSTTPLLNLTVAGTSQDLAIKMVGVGTNPNITMGLPGASNTFAGYVGTALSGTLLFSFDRTSYALQLNGALTLPGIITAGSGSKVLTNADGTIKQASIEQNGATNGQALSWNNSGGYWEPQTPAGAGDMSLADAQTNTGNKTFNNGTLLLRNVANSFNGVFTNTNSADRTYTLPDVTGTIALTTSTVAKSTNLVGGAGGSIPYQSAADTTVLLANGTAGQYLKSNGTTLAPSWETFSGGSGDMVLADAQTNTGAKTFNNTTLLLRNVADSYNGSFLNTNTADRVYTLPDLAGTVALTSTDTKQQETIIVALSDEDTDLTASTTVAKMSYRVPTAFTLSDIKASLTTAGTDATVIMDVHLNGTTIMTTDKLDIESGEFTTDDATTQPVLTTTALSAGDLLQFFVDQIGSTVAGTGAKVYMIGNRT